MYTGFTLISLPLLRSSEDGKSLLTFLLCAVWAGDMVALYVGRAWGTRKLAPTLSPNKTWAGAVGSVLGSLLVTVLLMVLAVQLAKRDILTLAFPGTLAHWLLLALVVNVAAQVGDLAESALKRSAGVKDSGTLLPGHGGRSRPYRRAAAGGSGAVVRSGYSALLVRNAFGIRFETL